MLVDGERENSEIFRNIILAICVLMGLRGGFRYRKKPTISVKLHYTKSVYLRIFVFQLTPTDA